MRRPLYRVPFHGVLSGDALGLDLHGSWCHEACGADYSWSLVFESRGCRTWLTVLFGDASRCAANLFELVSFRTLSCLDAQASDRDIILEYLSDLADVIMG